MSAVGGPSEVCQAILAFVLVVGVLRVVGLID